MLVEQSLTCTKSWTTTLVVTSLRCVEKLGGLFRNGEFRPSSTHFDPAGFPATGNHCPGRTLTTDADPKSTGSSARLIAAGDGIAWLRLNRASLAHCVERKPRPERLAAIAQQSLALVQLEPAKIVRYNLRYVHFDTRGEVLLRHRVLEFRRP
jgi:hypothetical protein